MKNCSTAFIILIYITPPKNNATTYRKTLRQARSLTTVGDITMLARIDQVTDGYDILHT